MDLPLALTFDDVLLVPQESDVLPTEVQTRTRFSRNVKLVIPVTSAAMDTVTESRLAIGLAQQGGIGIIHRNLSIDDQVREVDIVKRSAHGIIHDPLTLEPDDNVGTARQMMAEHNISGLPVVDDGKVVGILTRRDLKYQGGDDQLAKDVMSKNLVTAPPETSLAEAKKILYRAKVEKLILANADGSLAGLITMRDIRLAKEFPDAAKDRDGCLIAGAAVGVHDYDRAEALVSAGVDVLVVDTAHGHSANVMDTVRELKKRDLVDVVAGNIASQEAAEGLIDAGVDGVKVGIGPGSICTTRVVAGVGVPQFTAVYNVSQLCASADIPVIADGGIRHSGDAVKALGAGAESIMLGSLFAGVDESPGEIFLYQGRSFKAVRGMGSLAAMVDGGKARYGQANVSEQQKLVPEGIEGMVPHRGPLAPFVYQFVGGIRAGLGYIGAEDLEIFRAKARFVRITGAGMSESHPHDVRVTKEAPNYWQGT
ncbi:MAG: IMP dehydrogenase [Planctomycetes bacterium]|nr:IMP dehydrogenase [Planctomycetota bacterium]MCP4771710.1 IMP dehydrogenase [Planctomycetota bacterium]MCP4859990.1 IMP dehydrogenase [Planctomycetota bacterium]